MEWELRAKGDDRWSETTVCANRWAFDKVLNIKSHYLPTTRDYYSWHLKNRREEGVWGDQRECLPQLWILRCTETDPRGRGHRKGWKSYSNKMKYFRLRLSDEVGTERLETDLRLTQEWPETDLRQTYGRKMKIQSYRQTCAGKTDGRTDWLPELLTEPNTKEHPTKCLFVST